MQIISWNVNGMRAVLGKGFREWFGEADPDVLCLQETRVLPQELPEDIRAPKGYHAFWHPAKKKGYSGTGILTREKPKRVDEMGISEFDEEGRVQIAEFKKFVLLNGYWPNSQPERKRIDYKLRFCESIQGICNTLVKAKKHVVVCGDFNIAHEEIDLARPKSNHDSPGFLPEERAAMTRFLGDGYVDTFRHFEKGEGHYSWWSYRSGARAKNIGWRIDYHVVDKAFMRQLTGAQIFPKVMGSDHCPVGITLK